VRRPQRDEDFNGTVVLGWTNVSAGFEIATTPDRLGGFAHVAVSAQPTGIVGYTSTKLGLVDWDPERYGSLTIPDEGLCYDIFTLAARCVGPERAAHGPDPMGGLAVRKLIGAGGSQSGTRIMAYANAVQPRERVFDGLMPTICAGNGGDFASEMAHPDPATVTGRLAALTEVERTDPDAALKASRGRGHSRSVPVFVRDDSPTPVFAINTETEAFVYYPRRQPDSDTFCYWEIAGASHAGGRGRSDMQAQMDRDVAPGNAMRQSLSANRSQVDASGVYEAAMVHLHNWVTDGARPPAQPKIDIAGEPRQLVRDEHGNVTGGIRLPELEVPVAAYRGMDDNGSIGGDTTPFGADKLRRLYPTHDNYVAKVEAAAHAAVAAGVLLPERVEQYIREAREAAIPS
jgi:hypothetical protein